MIVSSWHLALISNKYIIARVLVGQMWSFVPQWWEMESLHSHWFVPHIVGELKSEVHIARETKCNELYKL